MTDKNTPEPKSIADVLGLNAAAPKRWWRKKGWWFAIAAVVIAVVLFMVNRGNEQKISYETQAVTRGDLAVTVSATGTLAPSKEVEVGIEVSGTIRSVEADYNDRVTVGQVLARLDTTRLEAQALQSQSALESARAKLQQVRATVQESNVQLAKRQHVYELSGGKAPSQYDMDAAKATLARAYADEAAAKAAVNQAQGLLNVNRTDLTKAVVKSPINGVVLKRSVEPGQTVASTFQAPVLFKLAEDLTKMELQVDVDEADVGLVKSGQNTQFTVDAYADRTFPAEITQVRFGSETVDGVVTYKTVLKVDNSALSLRPGMTATAIITVEQKTNVLVIPNSVLRFTPPVVVEKASSDGTVLGTLFQRPPRTVPDKESALTGKKQKVWTLLNGELSPITITKGASNGIVTEIVAGDVKVGTELVSGQANKP